MLQGRVVLVTGSSSGVGLAIAKAVKANGGLVLVHGSSPSKVAAAVETLGGVPSCVADLALPETPARLVEATLTAYGRIDAVVNNAGIFPRANLDTTDLALFEHIFAINTRAPLFVTQRAVAAFRAQKSPGNIVNIGSVNAYSGQPDLLPYSMSKGALMTMTRNLGDALGPENIRVNQLNVGWTLTETEIETQRAAGRPDGWYKAVPPLFAPSGNILAPEMVAEHALFWLSDRSAPVTGQVYEVEQFPIIGRQVMSRII
jgi:NAD(P)-dependent dehydrogenase (short-subunit alcohol dehydrogenase family)